jgi:Zn-dependent M16 (insulinase) family peptidase
MEHTQNSPHSAFKITQITPLQELNATLIQLEHITSHAKVLHLQNDDPENLFCLSFQTIPDNSNGVAHILEHTVLCGSKKFPVKDPFFAMTRRSLTTFMNALTGADFTCYPAATQVENDFYNLLDVYLDAVFYPDLKKESFLQEGHRLELVDPKNTKSPLIFKGIVFNEMKGALASPDSRLWHLITKALVPDLTYAHISGGDPAEIPSLTYEDLIDFHKTYYHPSRCLFFFYGNLPLKKHLEVLENTILKNAHPISPLSPLPKQPRFSAPKYVEGVYPLSDEKENQGMIAWGFLTVSASDQETLLELALLDAILMETDASPLKLALLESGLCTTADAFLDLDMSEVPYVIVCKGCNPSDADALEKILFKTLKEIASKEISLQLIESALHQLEMAKTEISGDHNPFGLTLFLRAALCIQHGGKADSALKIHTLFENLRKKLKNPDFLRSLLKTHLIDNPHRVRALVRPDATLLEKEQEKENEGLKILAEYLSEEEREKIAQTMHHLENFQKSQEHQNIECLPKVTLSDVPALSRHFPLKEEKNVLTHTTFTNGFIYADLVMDLPFLSIEELPWASLCASLLPEVGVGDRSYIQNLELLQAHVGGLSASINLYPLAEDPTQMRPALTLRGKALERNATALFEIMKEWALDVRFDEEKRISELIDQINTSLQQRLTKNALRYASSEALSGLSPAGFLLEKKQGLSYLQWIRDLPLILSNLQKMKEKLLSFHSPRLILTCSEKVREKLPCDELLDLPSRPFKPFQCPTPIPIITSHARPIAMPVAFTCQAMKVPSYLSPEAPALTLGSHLMDHLVLHPKIREQGGAYGAGSTYSPTLGHFTFHTFRDPHLSSSLDAFREAVEHISRKKFTNADLEAAKLESIQSLDAPASPGSRGSISYTLERTHLTPEMQQHFRDSLLSLTSENVAQAMEQELIPALEKSIVVSLASQDLIERENQKLQKPLPIIPI